MAVKTLEKNPLIRLESLGQSIWLDYIRKNILVSGELKRMIEEDGITGVTSNPAIFEKAIAESHDYDETIHKLAASDVHPKDIYMHLVVSDIIQQAADLFRPVYDKTHGCDGYVSLEVSPHYALDTEKTVEAARLLWKVVDRPNVLIKVPGTQPGLAAIRQLISEGINVNVTLLFSLDRYREVAEAYISGLESRLKQKCPINQIASVASFFLSRIDVLVDPRLEKRMHPEDPQSEIAKNLHGQVATSCAKVAYQIYQEIFKSDRFKKLAKAGAMPQRLLWASTSTKNPTYSDIKYVDALIGPETINTIPLETINAYRDHGNPALRLADNLSQAHQVLAQLPQLDIHLKDVTQQLEEEGIQKFIKPFDKLMKTIEEKRSASIGITENQQVLELGNTYWKGVQDQITNLKEIKFNERLWRKDPTLWKSDPESQQQIRNALGWLHVIEKMEDNLPELSNFKKEIKNMGFTHVVHMGMGGSSLAPLTFQRTFEAAPDGLHLTVLDTTDTATITKISQKMPLEKTLFIVASKSGTTAETIAFADYFYEEVKALKGDKAGENFIAITDPETPLTEIAEQRIFLKIFLNFPDIGGRYSALSYFGLVPAMLMGMDVPELLDRALRMKHACAEDVSEPDNPGVCLGAALGQLAVQHHRNKLTFIMSERLKTLGLWLEQLLAESTGKEEKGILPVAGEALGAPENYGEDRVFAYIHLPEDDASSTTKEMIQALQDAGHPVINIQLDDLWDIGQEFFRWEIATATAGAILGINPFDQPNVQESKDNTQAMLKTVENDGHLPEGKPTITVDPLNYYGPFLRYYGPYPEASLEGAFINFLSQAKAGDYIAIMAYLTENARHEEFLEAIQLQLRDHFKLATTIGYGPRFLHSTGQFHKGGPNTGLFIQLTQSGAEEILIPGRKYSFKTFEAAESLGDFQTLEKHKRRLIRIDLGEDTVKGFHLLEQKLQGALKEIHS